MESAAKNLCWARPVQALHGIDTQINARSGNWAKLIADIRCLHLATRQPPGIHWSQNVFMIYWCFFWFSLSLFVQSWDTFLAPWEPARWELSDASANQFLGSPLWETTGRGEILKGSWAWFQSSMLGSDLGAHKIHKSQKIPLTFVNFVRDLEFGVPKFSLYFAWRFLAGLPVCRSHNSQTRLKSSSTCLRRLCDTTEELKCYVCVHWPFLQYRKHPQRHRHQAWNCIYCIYGKQLGITKLDQHRILSFDCGEMGVCTTSLHGTLPVSPWKDTLRRLRQVFHSGGSQPPLKILSCCSSPGTTGASIHSTLFLVMATNHPKCGWKAINIRH